MDRDAMSSFLSTKSKYDSALCNPNTDTATDTNTSSEDERNQNLVQKTATTTNHTISLENIHETIDLILSKINPAVGRRCMSNISHGNHGSSKFRLRRAEHPSDAEAIYQLVKGLALYEKALEEVDVNETIYQLDSSGENPFYHCILLELDQVQMGTDVDNTNNDTSNKVVGMGFFYFGSSMTNNKNSPSPFLYLEDLFIEEEYRGNGFGKSIMYVLAEISKELGCERFVWQALEWNFPALKFYNSIGAKICDGLTTLRLSRENLV
jgi:ribosomal protein S18 acetylase RimI-like enzyme